MIKKISSYKILFISIIFITAVISNNITVPSLGRPRFLLEIALMIIGFVSILLVIKKRNLPKLPHIIIFVLLLSTFSSALNSIVIDDIRPFRTFFFTNISIIGIYLMFSDKELYLKRDFITKLIIFLGLIIIFSSLIYNPIQLFRYSGILDYSQSMGRVSGYLILLFSSYFLFMKKSFYSNLFLFFLIMTTFVILIATNSRTPLFIFLLFLLPLIILFNMRGVGSIFRFVRFNVRYFIFIPIIIFFIFYYLNNFVSSGSPLFNSLYDNFAYQFTRDPGSYGTSDRIPRWIYAINEYYSFFGSKEYNDLSFSKIEVHNNYISQTLKFGLIPAICFHIFPFIILFKSIYRIIKNNCSYSVIPFALSFYLILYYIFETSAAIMPFWLMLIYDAILNKRHNSEGIYEKK